MERDPSFGISYSLKRHVPDDDYPEAFDPEASG